MHQWRAGLTSRGALQPGRGRILCPSQDKLRGGRRTGLQRVSTAPLALTPHRGRTHQASKG